MGAFTQVTSHFHGFFKRKPNRFIVCLSEQAAKSIEGTQALLAFMRQPEKQQADLYRELAAKAHKLSDANPNMAEPLIWEGIVVSSEAGVRGALSREDQGSLAALGMTELVACAAPRLSSRGAPSQVCHPEERKRRGIYFPGHVAVRSRSLASLGMTANLRLAH